MPTNDEPSADDFAAKFKQGEAIYMRIVAEVQRDLGLAVDATFLAKEVRKRVNALPPDERDLVEAYLEAIASSTPPGFHEGGAH